MQQHRNICNHKTCSAKNKTRLKCHKSLAWLTSQFSNASMAILSLSSFIYRSSSALSFTILCSVASLSWITFFFFSDLQQKEGKRNNNRNETTYILFQLHRSRRALILKKTMLRILELLLPVCAPVCALYYISWIELLGRGLLSLNAFPVYFTRS